MKTLNSYQLKLIAVIAMTVDHLTLSSNSISVDSNDKMSRSWYYIRKGAL